MYTEQSKLRLLFTKTLSGQNNSVSLRHYNLSENASEFYLFNQMVGLKMAARLLFMFIIVQMMHVEFDVLTLFRHVEEGLAFVLGAIFKVDHCRWQCKSS